MTTENSHEINPLLLPWTGPFGGVPRFDDIKPEHFKPAFEEAMAKQLVELDAIGSNDKAPDFGNTIEAFERSGKMFAQVQAVYRVWSSSLSTKEFQEVEVELEPKLAAFEDAIYQHEMLFKRITSVYNSAEKEILTPEQQRLLWMHYTDFVRAGAKLSAAEKLTLSGINQKLATLFTRFSQNILADEQQFVVIESASDLSGLPDAMQTAAKTLAEEKGIGEKWLILNTRSAVDPFLTYANNRDLRERVWSMFTKRGDNGNANDNNEVVREILELRLQRAHMLGYETHAHWALENTMAKSPTRALALLEQVWTPATERVKQEVKDMQLLAHSIGDDITIEPWDYRYYMEKVRKDRFDLDDNELRPYLQLDKLRDSMFYVAHKLFGMVFTPIESISVFHPDVKVWEVNTKDQKHLGLFYFDPFARAGKRSGAWMTDYREQHKLDGKISPIVSNNSNFMKGQSGEVVLISWDDATTLFHEFGHALHGLSSNVTYPSLSGTNVVRDYVEFPSQLLEHWLMTPEVLERFATHYQTGKPIPASLVSRLRRATTFNQGFGTTEYLASALLDMKVHLAQHSISPGDFEKDTLTKLGMPRELVMRHRTPHFLHIFSDDGYAAGYYSYLWADVITADAYNAFEEESGPYDQNVADKLFNQVLSVGNTVDPGVGYRNFRGKDPSVDALLIKRGFKS